MPDQLTAEHKKTYWQIISAILMIAGGLGTTYCSRLLGNVIWMQGGGAYTWAMLIVSALGVASLLVSLVGAVRLFIILVSLIPFRDEVIGPSTTHHHRRIPVLLAVFMLLVGPPLAFFAMGNLLSDDYLVTPELDHTLRNIALVCMLVGIAMTIVSAKRLDRRLFSILFAAWIIHP